MQGDTLKVVRTLFLGLRPLILNSSTVCNLPSFDQKKKRKKSIIPVHYNNDNNDNNNNNNIIVITIIIMRMYNNIHVKILIITGI